MAMRKFVAWGLAHRSMIRAVLFVAPIPLSLAFLALKVFWSSIYDIVIQEDSYLENQQVVGYFSACAVASIAAWSSRTRRQPLACFLFAVIASFTLFVGLEEISWGQRIFGVETPGFFLRNNTQGETNVHNLRPIQNHLIFAYVVAGFILFVGWLPAFFVSKAVKLNARVRWFVAVFSPRWYLAPYFLPLLILYSYLLANLHKLELFGCSFAVGGFVVWRDQEPAESMLALGFYFYCCAAFVTARSRRIAEAPAKVGSREFFRAEPAEVG